MSYPLPYIKPALVARLLADTTSGGLFNVTTPLVQAGAVYWDVVPPEQARPYIVLYFSRPIEPTDALRTRRRLFHVAAQLVDDKKPADEHDATERTAKIIDRIEGDWDEQAAGTQPTYGFDRWVPTLSGATNWLADAMQLQSIDDDSDDETYSQTLHFTVTANKTGA